MKNLKKYLLNPIQVVVLAVIISGVATYAVYATGSYSEPGCSPTSCNADAPINISNVSQIKDARLTVANVAPPSGVGFEVVNGQIKIDSYNTTNSSLISLEAPNGYVKAKGFFYSSDAGLKTNILPLKDALSKVLQLQGVSYNWKDSGIADVGVTAQNVEKVYPELVHGEKGSKTVEEANLVGPLIEAIKAQQKQIDQLKAEVEALKNK